MTKKQFRVLYREFLFRIVDRELLSTYAKGDMSQLLLQVATLMIFLSVCFSLPAIRFLNLDRSGPVIAGLWFEWSIEHFLIATTMLVVGLFAVLSWRSMFPDHRDVLVLAPLPIRAHTLLLAKLSAVATAMGLIVVALHAVAGLAWPAALNVVTEARAVQPFTSDEEMPPVGAADLQTVLDRDLAQVLRSGPLAPGAGGGLAIGVHKQGVRRVFAHGSAAPDSIFEIGSITKPFTALALARMVEEGKVRLDLPVRALVLTARLPQPVGPEITLLDLATHHSGLPPLPWNLRPRDMANPYADYDLTQLYRFLENRGVGRQPAEPFVYSNLGYALLAHALTLRADVDYPTLIRRTVTGPLGLRDTVVGLSADQAGRFLQGYNDRRRAVRPWDTGLFAGAGALRSTAPDMLAWLEANLHPERFPDLTAAIAASHQIRAPRATDGPIALGWWIDTASGNVQHGGAVAGFTSDAFFNPKEDVAAVVLANTGPGSAVSADVVANHVRARLAGTPAIAVAERVLPAAGTVRSWIRLLAALRTLFRSSQHRVLLALYWGIGFALIALLLKTPRAQQLALEPATAGWLEGSVPLVVASIWMMGCAVLAARLAFSLPRDLAANWIFRTAPITGARHCLHARRRALLVVSVLPVWTGAAIVFLRAWPVGPALGHIAALGLLGLAFVEISLRGTQKIPFTCSYLPGKSRFHIAVYIAIALLGPLTFAAAEIERGILQTSTGTALMLGGLVVVWTGLRWRTIRQLHAERSEPEFEEEPTERILTLEVWDSRFGQLPADH
jgi:CubicO group peptidase (beta-lactamase class C family)